MTRAIKDIIYHQQYVLAWFQISVISIDKLLQPATHLEIRN